MGLSLKSVFLVLALAAGPLWADTFRSYESPDTPEVLRWKLVALLDRLDRNNYGYEPETLGFSFAYYNLITSPFSYNLYAGTVSARQPITVLRLEGNTGDVYTLSHVLRQEKLVQFEDPAAPGDMQLRYAPLEEKYHSIGQPLNWVAPWLGVLHSSYNSPRLSSGQTVFRFSMYLGLDVVLVWAAGRNWFRDKWDGQKYAGNIAAALFVPRLVGAAQSFNQVRGHNRLVEMKYTFPVQ
jgi:hypothetical protein